ncbi:hypothetical protein [Desulfobacter vibrioformis]|uniref:hypothetical protein n=1 Tax=Desulfobacter vibrioformis TaxID=34031 RepID=UPI000552399D|nr:hypothetical protein [Desulfobacter vibrioformis]
MSTLFYKNLLKTVRTIVKSSWIFFTGEEAVIRSLKQIIEHLAKIAEYARQLDEEEAGCKSNEG